jgi:hypothetical protein
MAFPFILRAAAAACGGVKIGYDHVDRSRRSILLSGQHDFFMVNNLNKLLGELASGVSGCGRCG